MVIRTSVLFLNKEFSRSGVEPGIVFLPCNAAGIGSKAGGKIAVLSPWVGLMFPHDHILMMLGPSWAQDFSLL